MSIIRTKNREKWVTVDKKPIEDNRLSWQAKGLLTYLLSKPNDWHVHVNQLSKASKNGRDATRKAIQELVDFGYIIRNYVRNDKGQMVGCDYLVCEESISENVDLEQIRPLTEKPTTDKPISDKPFTENPTLLNNDLLSNEDTKEGKNKSVPTDVATPVQSPVFENYPLNQKPKASDKVAVQNFIESRGGEIQMPEEEIEYDKLTYAAAKLVRYISEKSGNVKHPINRKTGVPAKYMSLVRARIKEYGYDTMIKVVDAKVAEWLHIPAMREHLVPETLCKADKSEKYVDKLEAQKNQPNNLSSQSKGLSREEEAEQIKKFLNGDL
jgi:uncharacterized phage protein (TIGR02220 family)